MCKHNLLKQINNALCYENHFIKSIAHYQSDETGRKRH